MNYICNTYKPTSTLQKFHWDKSFVRGIRGPFGSGKSVGMCMEILSKAAMMPVSNEDEKVRYSKWAIIRATYPELMGSTLPTWKKVLPYNILNFTLGNRSIPRCEIKMQNSNGDGTVIDLLLEFYAIDSPDLVDKLASFEYTGAWINEAREVPYEILHALTGRVGRYPNKIKSKDGKEIPFWSGIIMDTNPPDNDHWWYRLAEIDRPIGYSFFSQPAALIKDKKTNIYIPNVEAENIDNLPKGYRYYENMLPGKDEAWIKVYIQGLYGTISHGRAIYPMFNENEHISKENLEVYRALPIYAGVDFGFNAAVSFAQYTKFGQLRVVGEIFQENITTRDFIQDYIKPYITNRFGDVQIQWYGDPAGMTRGQTDGVTCIQEYLRAGINIIPAPTNSPLARIQSVTSFLNKRGGFIIDKNSPMLIKGFCGEYCFDRLRVSEERYSSNPTKNKYSHLAESLQYLTISIDPVFGLQNNTRRIIKKAPHRWAV